MQQTEITAQEAGQRLLRYLSKVLPDAPQSFFYKMLRKKNITLNGKKAQGAEQLDSGDIVRFFLADETMEKFGWRAKQPVKKTAHDGKKAPLEIVYEDAEILVVNKPAGMLSQKAKKEDISLNEYVVDYIESTGKREQTTFRPGICNRLDRNTTGLVVAGKTVRSLQYLNRLFRERALEKYYICPVEGKIAQPAMLEAYLQKEERNNRVRVANEPCSGAVPIKTAYTPLQTVQYQGREYTLLQIHLITGKSHQIRAHLASIGHPLIGDAKYGTRETCALFLREFGVSAQLLHAWRLRFGDAAYLSEQYQGKEFVAPLPRQLCRVAKGMGFDMEKLDEKAKNRRFAGKE